MNWGKPNGHLYGRSLIQGDGMAAWEKNENLQTSLSSA